MLSDVEMAVLCAHALGAPLMGSDDPLWNPLHDDAQAMALVKRFGLTIYCEQQERGLYWEVDSPTPLPVAPHGTDLNRAIVECVSRMQSMTQSADCHSNTHLRPEKT